MASMSANSSLLLTVEWLNVMLLFVFSYLLTELMDNYKKDEEKDVQNNTVADQGGFIELTSHKTTKENTGKCCSIS